MIFYPGQNVKLFFRNNLQISGVVEKYDNNELVLKSFDSKNQMIILHPQDDIVAITINVEEKLPESPPGKVKDELTQKFEEVYNSPSENDLRIKELAELKSLLLEQEKKIISNKLKSHTISNSKPTTYEYPGFLSKPSSK